jgi:hypothetical protein
MSRNDDFTTTCDGPRCKQTTMLADAIILGRSNGTDSDFGREWTFHADACLKAFVAKATERDVELRLNAGATDVACAHCGATMRIAAGLTPPGWFTVVDQDDMDVCSLACLKAHAA